MDPTGESALDSPMRVGVVIVTNEGPGDRLDRCLTGVVGEADSIVVVDNSGADRALAAKWRDRAVIHLAVPNLGYGAAVNRGWGVLRAQGVDAFLALNDDVVIDSGWRPQLARHVAGDDVGVVQPKLLLADRSPPVINSLGVELDRYGAGTDVGLGMSDDHTPSDVHDIEMFTGGAAMILGRFFDDLGGFDERIFLYYEDVDLSLRAARRGWRIRCDPAAVAWHEKGSSTDELGANLRYHQERSRLFVAMRHLPWPTVRRAFALSLRRLRHPPRGAHARAVLAAVGMAPRVITERVRS